MDTIKEKYNIHKLIAYGAFGRIYTITDKKSKKEYILKESAKINKESLNETDKKEDENEISFLKIVKGENIVKMIEHYQDDKDDFYYIILEKMDGDLYQLVEEKYKNGMDSSLIRKIFSQINSGIKDMHKKDKCHRDLKPSNIFYSYINDKKKDFIVKLGDFGFSTDLKSTQYVSIAGSKFYQAPEVEEGKFSNKCDLYSIGIILYYLKTGEYIFDGKKELDILINKDKNIIKKDTNDELLNKLIRKLVVKDPHDRMDWKEYFEDPFFKENEIKIYNEFNNGKI